ncbi:MAG: sodium-independent anion transporter, partial [Gammaproteobacteria bacterium]
LEFAIYLGVLLSLVLFLAKTSTPKIPTLSIDMEYDGSKRKFSSVHKKPLKECPQLKIIRVDMSIYFGSINYINKVISNISEKEGIYNILIVASGINFIDLAGAEVLVTENNRLRKNNGGLYFVGMKSSVYEFAAKSCFIKKIGSDRFFDSKTNAIRSIYARLDKTICEDCSSRIFNECQ